MRHEYDLPFGARLMDGQTRFRLWAPAARTVELVLESGSRPRRIDMERDSEGWCEATVADAASGTHYRFRIDGHLMVPDPASRYQPDDVPGPSEVIAPLAWDWQDHGWRGRPWEEAVLYELHVGTFTPGGTFASAVERLDHLRALGVTAVEFMPIADFAGRRNWGYDGVLPYAPDSAYGRPEDLKRFIQEAHARGIMVFLDVVYNHFGPEGNFLHAYAPQFFTDRHQTPWGAAIDFDGAHSHAVREFFIHNALYWLTEYRFDGLRLDSVHAIHDATREHFLAELARRVRAGPGRERAVHLMLENDRNEAHWLERAADGSARAYDAQWNDDWHHVVHRMLTGEEHGYYADYAPSPEQKLLRCLREGYAYQGEPSPYRDAQPRGEASGHLPPAAFINFLQNHDQTGNRARGDRLSVLAPEAALEAARTLLLLAPSPPMLFMGEEWQSRQPFFFFCDFGPELAAAVRAGRRREFARFPQFAADAQHLPDPNAPETFEQSRPDWEQLATDAGMESLRRCRDLLEIRHRELVPRLRSASGNAVGRLLDPHGLTVTWRLADNAALSVVANLHPAPARLETPPCGRRLAAVPEGAAEALERSEVLPWSVAWFLE